MPFIGISLADPAGKAGRMDSPEVIVVGAGIGGLTAAIRLAVQGHKVLVLERNRYVGGKMAEITESGYRFDTGPSVITMRPVLEELFSFAGRRLDDYLSLEPVEPLTRYFFPDGIQLDISRSLALTMEQIQRLEPRDVEGYLSFLAYAARLHRITAPVFTYGPAPTFASFLKVNPLDAITVGMDALRSMDAVVRRYVRDPHLRQLLGRFATYVGSSPYLASATLSVIAHVELNEGVYYPRGGIYAIARALDKLAREVGVIIQTQSDVDKISYSQCGEMKTEATKNEGFQASDFLSQNAIVASPKYCVNGVYLKSGEFIPAKTVIANLDVASVYENLLVSSAAQKHTPTGAKNEAKFRNASLKSDPSSLSCSGFVLLLGVEGQYPQLAHHNIFFSSDYRLEFDQIFKYGQPPDDPTIYVAITSKTDPEHAPVGCENWFVLVNVPPADSRYDWQQHAQSYAALVKNRLAEKGFDIRTRLRVERLITPLDLERMNGARRGSLYGVSFNDRLAPFKRPGNRAKDVQGLYFVGGTTHPGGGVPMVMLSGKLVSEMIGRV